MNESTTAKPEVRGAGRVLYRCAECHEQLEPDAAAIVEGLAYHPEHVPEDRHDGR